jgi:1-deoxy-D-xylulose-5-phosphate synthase
MTLLEQIKSPDDLKAIPQDEIPALCEQIRETLIDRVSKTGGHLGPNLGVVELTVAIHRVYESPSDVVVWDTGHQSYVHKMLTGRTDQFDTLRQRGGLSGYPSRAESEHDVVENSHASTALSWADGIATAFEAKGELNERHVVAVIGDGALTGGMAWEALNNIAGKSERPIVLIVNDNARSYGPTIGGLAQHLAGLRTSPKYEAVLDWGKNMLGRTPVVGSPMYEALHGVKKGLKDVFVPQGMFEDLGLKYIGPVDGHDELAVERVLRQARRFPGPVLVHVLTDKGHGYAPAVDDEAEKFHGIGIIDPDTGQPLTKAGPTWKTVFADELVAIGAERPDVVAITAAMPGPTGLDKFGAVFPNRMFDVGIAEQHAATSAAGMAFAGLHPVVAVYATFLNRAFDQVLFDCALHKAGVTFVLVSAGVTGDDGASHNGMWDMSLLQIVPGLVFAAPRDGRRLRELLREAVDYNEGPSVVRFPKGGLVEDVPAVESRDGVDVLYEGGDDVLIVSVGAMAHVALEVAGRLADQGITATVVDPLWIKPLPSGLVTMAAQHRAVVVLEDGLRVSGVASAISQLLRDHRVFVPQFDFGIPLRFLEHGTQAQVREECGLTASPIALEVVEAMARLDAAARI